MLYHFTELHVTTVWSNRDVTYKFARFRLFFTVYLKSIIFSWIIIWAVWYYSTSLRLALDLSCSKWPPLGCSSGRKWPCVTPGWLESLHRPFESHEAWNLSWVFWEKIGPKCSSNGGDSFQLSLFEDCPAYLFFLERRIDKHLATRGRCCPRHVSTRTAPNQTKPLTGDFPWRSSFSILRTL